MRSNIDDARRTVESFEETTQVFVDGDPEEVLLRVLLEPVDDDQDVDAITNEIRDATGTEVVGMAGTPFGTEVTLK